MCGCVQFCCDVVCEVYFVVVWLSYFICIVVFDVGWFVVWCDGVCFVGGQYCDCVLFWVVDVVQVCDVEEIDCIG